MEKLAAAQLDRIAELEAQNKKLRETLNYIAEQAEEFYEPRNVNGAQVYFVKESLADHSDIIQEILVVASESVEEVNENV